jgi:hypothetical protein
LTQNPTQPFLSVLQIVSTIMADVATSSGAAIDAKKTVVEKPEKPDEETYKASLKKAEKEHADAMAKFVREHPIRISPYIYICTISLSSVHCIDLIDPFHPFRMPSRPNWTSPSQSQKTPRLRSAVPTS